MRRSLATLAAAAPLVLLLAGCSGRIADPLAAVRSKIPPASTAIVPDSPRALADAFIEAVNHRDVEHYGALFTGDFEFAFAAFDSAGSDFPGRRLTRELELEYAQHLFVTGTASNPPALKIVLTMDRTFFPEPDSRPGRTFPWHQEVRRNFILSVDTGDQAFRITGSLRFFFVRGDSAAIPPDLAARGFHPDPNRWWIERWEDEGMSGIGAPNDGPVPVKETTWGDLKWLYLVGA